MANRLNIYVSHSKKKMDYEKELYKPLLDSKIGKENNFILPHSEEYNDVDTKANIDKFRFINSGGFNRRYRYRS